MRRRAQDLLPIPNGIDTMLWNPARDPHLGTLRFSFRDLSNKSRCKAVLQREFGLRVERGTTLMAMGSRLTEQKMADVAVQTLPEALERYPDLQVAILGQGDHRLEHDLQALAQRYPGRCAAHIGYDEPAAHRLHAGADILLHASRFEPFGLTPLYAMRYGALPIGSRVGGMADTIEDPGPAAPLSAMASANGLLFDGDSSDAMGGAIARAMLLREHAMLWRTMQGNAMRADFGWRSAIGLYARLYRSLAVAGTRDVARARAGRAIGAAALGIPRRPDTALPAPV
ncbi:Glycogen synthase [compost metagenome]